MNKCTSKQHFRVSAALPGGRSPKTQPPKKPPPEVKSPHEEKPALSLPPPHQPGEGLRIVGAGATTPGSPSPEPPPPRSLQIRARGTEEPPGVSLPDRETLPPREERRPSLPLPLARAATAAAGRVRASTPEPRAADRGEGNRRPPLRR
ncbi:Os10g0431100 [Oryza sativa Japonica Group]|jgi:hypothetical protein|uniref:Os10g0431100 protein n=1 Tax=Oryza sativa subsp. japonica TaxID=39947 RepID=A0A0N7KRU0_ORYSJ|nr:Os10g0431100 [Oryza sativa Japonica Group]